MRRVFLAALLLVTACSQGGTEAKPARWLHQFGSAVDDTAFSVATDAAGNVVVAGGTSGALEGETSRGDVDLFVTKYDSAGARLWTRQFGTGVYDLARAVATDVDGNIVVVGFTDGALGGNTELGDTDAFVIKYDPAGTRLWTRQFGTSKYDVAWTVATDASGDIFVAGYTFGAFEVSTNAGGADLFVVKYDAAGTMLWARQLGSSTYDAATSVATDGAGYVVVAGRGGTGGAADGGGQMLVCRYNPTGTYLSVRASGGRPDDEATSVATDSAGDVLVAGYTVGQVGGDPSAGSSDLFVKKLDGTHLTDVWARQLGTPAADEARSVATDAAGNVVVVGSTRGGLDGNASAGDADLFIVKYDASGTKLWTRQLGTAGYDVALSVATDPAGDILVAGTTRGGLEGNTSAGGADAFVLKIGGDGLR